MATIKNGILGTISGKVGGLVFSTYRGKQYVRSLPKKNNRPPTDSQLAQRMRVAMIAGFFNGLRPLIRRGFGTNAAMSYNLKNAIVGTYPHLEIDYSEIVLTKGILEGAASTVVSGGCEGIGFEWEYSSNFYNSFQDDEAILIAYNPARDWHTYQRTRATRNAGHANLALSGRFSGDTFHCWIVFISTNGKEFSTSRYLGTVVVA